MKKFTTILIPMLLIGIIGTVGCQYGSPEEVAFKKDIEQFKKDIKIEIAANEQIIKEFKAKIVNNTAEAKADYNEKIESMEQKNAEMKKKLNEYKLEGKDEWDSFKAEFKHDMNEMGESLKDLTTNNI